MTQVELIDKLIKEYEDILRVETNSPRYRLYTETIIVLRRTSRELAALSERDNQNGN